MIKGTVFNMQHYSVHDGPGIRTIVFFKGCPLNCRWCSNPESHYTKPEVAFNKDKCIGSACKMCLKKASEHIDWNQTHDQPMLTNHRDEQVIAAARLCPARAMTVYGREMTVNEVMREIEKDGTFYARSGGGVTFSGGEPLMQPEFLQELVYECKKRSVHTSIETTAFAKWEIVRPIFAALDYLLVDLKHIDPVKHEEWTGVTNAVTMENLKRIQAEFPHKQIRVRTPVIPGFNDDAETLGAIANFVKTELPNAEYELLKYHRFGLNKYEFIGQEYPLDRELELEQERFDELKKIVLK